MPLHVGTHRFSAEAAAPQGADGGRRVIVGARPRCDEEEEQGHEAQRLATLGRWSFRLNGMRSAACVRDAADRRSAAARPAKWRWSAALPSQDLVGRLLLNTDRRILIQWLSRARGGR